MNTPLSCESMVIGGTTVQTVTSDDPAEGDALGMAVEGYGC